MASIVGEKAQGSRNPHQCNNCGNWFYDLPGWPQGKHGCRRHQCDLGKIFNLAEQLADSQDEGPFCA